MRFLELCRVWFIRPPTAEASRLVVAPRRVGQLVSKGRHCLSRLSGMHITSLCDSVAQPDQASQLQIRPEDQSPRVRAYPADAAGPHSQRGEGDSPRLCRCKVAVGVQGMRAARAVETKRAMMGRRLATGTLTQRMPGSTGLSLCLRMATH